MDIQSIKEYQDWLKTIKHKVKVARVKAALSANKELIHFYFELGKMISEQQTKATWGDKLLALLSKDLSDEFPDMKGFSTTNLKYCRQFHQFYQSEISQRSVDQLLVFDFGQHLVDQLPLGHNILIFTKSKTILDIFAINLMILPSTLVNQNAILSNPIVQLYREAVII